MVSTTDHRLPAPHIVPQIPVGTWSVGPNTVSLFRESTLFAFSIQGRDELRRTFNSKLYSADYAENLIVMFHRTIGTNLNRDEPSSACFLPRLCTAAQNDPGVHVALFGHVDTQRSSTGDVRGLRWGVFDSISQEEHTFEVCDPIAESFVLGAPNTNHPHMESVPNEQGKSIMRPSSDHCAMDSYAKRFGVFLERDESRRIQKVFLHRVSLLNRQLQLDEDHWAVTMVSAKDISRNALARFFFKSVGHMMVACEGVERGRPFLRYIHLTAKPIRNDPVLEKDEGLIEMIDRTAPLDTLNGPTWTRCSALVRNMFEYVKELSGVPVKFAFSGHFFWGPSFFIESGREVVLHDIEGVRERLRVFDDRTKVPSSCLDWARVIVRQCGIITGHPLDSMTTKIPLEEIQRLNSCDIALMPNNFDDTCLGTPFSGSNIALRTQILFSSVFLSPSNCSPETCKRWMDQWALERNGASLRYCSLIREVHRRGYGVFGLWDVRPGVFNAGDRYKKDPYTFNYEEERKKGWLYKWFNKE